MQRPLPGWAKEKKRLRVSLSWPNLVGELKVKGFDLYSADPLLPPLIPEDEAVEHDVFMSHKPLSYTLRGELNLHPDDNEKAIKIFLFSRSEDIKRRKILDQLTFKRDSIIILLLRSSPAIRKNPNSVERLIVS